MARQQGIPTFDQRISGHSSARTPYKLNNSFSTIARSPWRIGTKSHSDFKRLNFPHRMSRNEEEQDIRGEEEERRRKHKRLVLTTHLRTNRSVKFSIQHVFLSLLSALINRIHWLLSFLDSLSLSQYLSLSINMWVSDLFGIFFTQLLLSLKMSAYTVETSKMNDFHHRCYLTIFSKLIYYPNCMVPKLLLRNKVEPNREWNFFTEVSP